MSLETVPEKTASTFNAKKKSVQMLAKYTVNEKQIHMKLRQQMSHQFIHQEPEEDFQQQYSSRTVNNPASVPQADI